MFDGVVGDNFAAMENHDARADAFHRIKLMRAEEHYFTARGEFLDQTAQHQR